MCGIAGLIHRDGVADIGREMTAMLRSLAHRGPDSTGFALYGPPVAGSLIMRLKLAEQDEVRRSFDLRRRLPERKAMVDARIAELGGTILSVEAVTEYAYRYALSFAGDRRRFADYIEDVEGVEILSLGIALELIKDLGVATEVAEQYNLGSFRGTHGIGHTRMATESDVDIRSAHPYWAYPYADISVVHNGQLTNYWKGRRALEHRDRKSVV
jgi:glutamate synthase domain-containing protein 1